ncbi:MAG TPA: hypothetical protein VGN32_00610 [Ktedonobacterales bacterium]|nr:hypothetical protein [Ktedonobacterales bacterium]
MPAPSTPANVRMMRPSGDTPRNSGPTPNAAMGAPAGGAPLSSEELELERIREILVGPHLRDHERRLRSIERQTADTRASTAPAEWRAQIEAAIERARQTSAAQTQVLQQEYERLQALQAELAHERQAREMLAQHPPTGQPSAEFAPLRDELLRERQSREAQAQQSERAIAQITARLDQEREEHEVHLRELQSLRAEQQAVRAELTREREGHDDLNARHVRSLAEVAARTDQRHEEHTGLHIRSTAELDARLERQRQAHAQQVDQLEAAHGERLRQVIDAHNAQVESLHQLVADAEQALMAMRAEREHLAGLLAELGMHLVRHAASPAAASADDASQTFLKAAAWWRRKPRT